MDFVDSMFFSSKEAGPQAAQRGAAQQADQASSG
jgi:hypothetical protein